VRQPASRPRNGRALDGTDGRAIRVVIIDDHLSVAEMMQLCLEHAGGFQVLGLATRGSAGLELIDDHRPDVLILDLYLPEMDGVEIARRVRTSFPDVAIVVWTGYPTTWPARQLLAGC
jgi:DNA-binding NarL/FixJ family response regulator